MASVRTTLEVATQELPDSQALVENLLHSSQIDHYGSQYQEVNHVLITSEPEQAQYELGPSAASYLHGHNLNALADHSGYSVPHGASNIGMGTNLGSNVYMHSIMPIETLAYQPAKHPSLQKPEHEDSRAKRRGPMDEMRQLVRIMVKFLPQSLHFLHTSDEPGGGNRVTEPQIKQYLKATLGEEAPQPVWGMPQGWGAYLADLFSWALGRVITDDEARTCACRQQGRSWQVKETRLAELGIFAYAWPLPLTQEGIAAAQLNPGDPPPGTNFIGPPPGWPHAESSMAGLGRPAPPAPKQARARPTEVEILPAPVVSVSRPMSVVARPSRPAVASPAKLLMSQAWEKPEEPEAEYEYLYAALQSVTAATRVHCATMNLGERSSDQILLVVDKIQALLNATYGTPMPMSMGPAMSQPSIAPPLPPLSIAHHEATTSNLLISASGVSLGMSDTPRVRASRALIEAHIQGPIQGPPYSPSKVTASASISGTARNSILVGSQPRQSPSKAVTPMTSGLVGKLPASQPTMDDLVSAAMTHVKANGDITTPSDTDMDDAARADALGRKRRREATAELGSDGNGVEGEDGTEGTDEDEDEAKRLQAERRERALRALSESQLVVDEVDLGVVGSSGPDTVSTGAPAAPGTGAASASAVSQLRRTIIERIAGGNGTGAAPTTTVSAGAAAVTPASVAVALPATVSAPPAVPQLSAASIQGRQDAAVSTRPPAPPSNIVNGIAVAGADMLPLASLPPSNRQRQSSGSRRVGTNRLM